MLLPLQLCKPGMRLGRSILNDEGVVLLGEGMELTSTMLSRLQQLGIHSLYIQDRRTEDLIIKDVVSQETRANAVSEVRLQFRKLMDESIRKRSVSSLRLGKVFKSVVDSIVDEISSNRDAMTMLMTMHASDHYLFQHSVNVCIYSTILGQAHGYSRDELATLSLGALLHDIGKTQIPQEVLMKPSGLTTDEYKIVQSHAMLGFKMLKDEPNVPLLSAHIALQHHERINGTGYPRSLSGEFVHEYAQWVGLVDSYDAMTTNRVYRSAMLPHHAMEIIYSAAGTLFDPDKVALFRDKVAIYPLGMIVTLNTGETGVVVDVNSSHTQRPIVRILYDANNEAVTPYEVDLSKTLSVMIEKADSAVTINTADDYA